MRRQERIEVTSPDEVGGGRNLAASFGWGQSRCENVLTYRLAVGPLP